MKNMKRNILFYVHAILLLWAIMFVGSLFISDGGKIAGTLAIGNALFLFVNIPLSVASFVLKAKNFFGQKYAGVMAVLSILNTVVGVAAWVFAVVLMQSPKFG